MRLLNTVSLRLESFFGLSAPEYVILSHTWGEEEVLFDDIRGPAQALPIQKKGFAKVKGGCVQARRDGYRYIWIDTCCIDKSSSAELSEAINSMFQWYHNSVRCYAYLADVDTSTKDWAADLEKSRWFRRGWTLQELIAPADVRFFDCNWSSIGRRRANNNVGKSTPHGSDSDDLAEKISQITGIPVKVLHWYPSLSETLDWSFQKAMPGPSTSTKPEPPSREALLTVLGSFSIAQRMSWAARRLTTRLEDEAYSLLGLFGVNMPLLYGEGRHAFFRLQQEILRISNDQSILAFVHQFPVKEGLPCPLLADSPRCFVDPEVQPPTTNRPVWPGNRRSSRASLLSPFPKILEFSLCLCPARSRSPFASEHRLFFGILDCVYQGSSSSHPAILLRAVDEEGHGFERIAGYGLRKISPTDVDRAMPTKAIHFFGMPHAVLQPDLSQATFNTVHLHYLPLDPNSNWTHLSSSEKLEQSPSGMRIRFRGPNWFPPFGLGSYPEQVELDNQIGDSEPQIFIPSTKTRYGLLEQGKVHEGVGDGSQIRLDPDPAFLFGVVILRSSVLGTLVFSWGAPPEITGTRSGWFAAFSWRRIAEASGLNQEDPGSELDLTTAARAIFESQGRWLSLVGTFPTPPVQQVESLRGLIQLVVDEKSFFGRPFLSADMILSPAGREETH